MKDTLNDKLSELESSDILPMHMPGHKRNPSVAPDGISYGRDITEIDGFDNLHSPTGVIRNIERKARELWGSDDAFISVNGASALLTASVLAHTKRGQKILVAANCHISVWHAIEIGGLIPVIVYPEIAEDLPFAMGISPSSFAAAYEEGVTAAVITTPTYEGVISDTRTIHDICREKGILLIADEAHGAHFGIDGDNSFPATADADIVVKSVHKTMNAPTQTAVLLTYGDKADKRLLRHYLSVTESTSPSYMLMAGLEKALYNSDADTLYKEAGKLREELSSLNVLRLFSCRYSDMSKIVLLTEGAISGYDLADILREKFLIEVEAAFPEYIIAMTGTGDTSSSLTRFADAIKTIDSTLTKPASRKHMHVALPSERKIQLSMEDAVRNAASKVPFEQATGEISAEYIFAYPPGVPLLIPGQVISEEVIELLTKYEERGVALKTDPCRTWDGKLLKVDTNA